MARSQALNEQMREASRARILETALELFSEHGYDRTSIRMIAEAAGISQGLLYNYFASKDEVLEAIVDQSMSDVQESFAIAEAGGSPAERIERLVRGAFEILRKNERFWRLSYSLRMQPGVLAGLSKRTRKSMSAIRQTLARYLREAGVDDPELEASILFALIDGVSQHYVLESGRYPLDAVAARIIERFQPARRSAARRKRASRS
ncbi:MAG: TetR/AcrR family transcriptional regulator [Gemmatimonadaceae bacterium]